MTREIVRKLVSDPFPEPKFAWNRDDKRAHRNAKTWLAEPGVSVAYVQSTEMTGINKHSGNRYYRWEDQQSISISKSPLTGRYSAYFRFNKRYSRAPYSSLTELSDVFEQTFQEPLTFKTLYPVAEYFGYDSNSDYTMSYGFSTHMKCANLYELTCSLFGKSRYRKDLARAVAKSTPAQLSIARNFRGLVPIDWIVRFLELPMTNNYGRLTTIGNLRPFLYQMPRSSLKSLLQGRIGEAEVAELNDVIRFAGNRVQPLRPRRWRDIHEAYVGHNAIHRFPRLDEPIRLTKKHLALDGLTAGDYTVKVADHTKHLYEWGQNLRNCIGSYASYAVSQPDLILGAVTDSDGKVVINFEIKTGRLRQFVGNMNRSNVELARLFEPVFANAGIDTTRYLGASDDY